MNIAILGAGGVAAALAWALEPLSPTVVSRSAVHRIQLSGPVVPQPVVRTVRWHPWDAPASPRWDLLLVAVKCPALPAVGEWMERHAPEVPALLWMNGMGQEAALARFRHGPLFPVVATLAVRELERGADRRHFQLNSLGASFLPQSAAPWVKPLAETAERTAAWPWVMLADAKLVERRWIKLIQNSVINPLTALTGLLNGAVTDHPLFSLASPLVGEAEAVARAEGVPLPAGMLSEVKALARATAHNASSMLQDVWRRHPTEIDSINGFIVRCGLRHRIACPTQRVVWRLVRQWEASWGFEAGNQSGVEPERERT